MSYIRSADAALYYEEYGAGDTLVLVPGVFGTIELDWRRFIPDLALHFHTIATDLRGHGRTDNPAGSLRGDQLLGDMLMLFDTLEIERAFLATVGVMGTLSLTFAMKYPERVLGLIVHSPRLRSMQTPRSPEAMGELFIPPFSDDVMQRAHAPANGSNGWENLRREINMLFTSVEYPVDESLLSFHVPFLATTGADSGPDEHAEIDLIRHAVRDCTVVHLLNSSGPMATVTKAEFITAVIAFCCRVAQQ